MTQHTLARRITPPPPPLEAAAVLVDFDTAERFGFDGNGTRTGNDPATTVDVFAAHLRPYVVGLGRFDFLTDPGGWLAYWLDHFIGDTFYGAYTDATAAAAIHRLDVAEWLSTVLQLDDDDHGPGCDGPLNCTCTPDPAP